MGLEELILKVVKEEDIVVGKARKGLEKDCLFVTNLLQQTDFTIEKIASLIDVDIAFVNQIRKEQGLK